MKNKGSNIAKDIVIEYEQRKRWEEKAKRLKEFREKKEEGKNGKPKANN